MGLFLVDHLNNRFSLLKNKFELIFRQFHTFGWSGIMHALYDNNKDRAQSYNYVVVDA